MQNDDVPLATVTPSGSAVAPLDLVALAEDAKAFLAAADADNTRKTSGSAGADLAAWCAGQGAESPPAAPEIVAATFTDRACTLNVATEGFLVALRGANADQQGADAQKGIQFVRAEICPAADRACLGRRALHGGRDQCHG